MVVQFAARMNLPGRTPRWTELQPGFLGQTLHWSHGSVLFLLMCKGRHAGWKKLGFKNQEYLNALESFQGKHLAVVKAPGQVLRGCL